MVLTAFAAKGYRFEKWTGGCETAKTLHCKLPMVADQTVGVRFKPARVLSLSSEGKGVIDYRDQGKDKSCKPPCLITVDEGSEVELQAKPAKGFRLQSWSDSCHGTDSSCKLIMTQDRSATVTFIKVIDMTLITSIGGKIVDDTVLGIECQNTCKRSIDAGSRTRLRAIAHDGYRFVKWGEDCQGEQTTCEIMPQGSAVIRAIFERVGAMVPP